RRDNVSAQPPGRAHRVDNYERIAYSILGALAVLWLLAVLAGMVALFPFGLLGLAVGLAIGILFIKVLKERLANKEDDRYDKQVDR
ncbi:MAG: hypothetical protein NZM12_02020, partial [Steroidobacteraceae bacterium]|nr:hypothetical protein [Steroidobacteraceae bacterium]MDW8260841.1 hypothetical protein [Gammaproteobacteria bacterium]